MRKEEVERIIEEKFAADPSSYGLFEVREEISQRICARVAPPNLQDSLRKLLRLLVLLEGEINAFSVRLMAERVALQVAALEQLLALYENCEKICGFLIDVYDRAPEYVKSQLTRDGLIELAADLRTEREGAYENLAENGQYKIPIVRMLAFKNLVFWATLTILGEERYRMMMAEANEAFAILRSHPQCLQFFNKS